MISDVEFAEGIIKVIKDERERIRDILASGKLGESHDQVSLRYRQLCGKLEGLEFIEHQVHDIIKRANYGGKD